MLAHIDDGVAGTDACVRSGRVAGDRRAGVARGDIADARARRAAVITRRAHDAEISIATDARDHVGCDFRRPAIFFLPSGSHGGNKGAL
jgi:hypothetical protein